MSKQVLIDGVGQIAIAVTDIDASLAFYRDVLGIELLFEVPPNMAFMNCSGVRLMLTTLQGIVEDHTTSTIYYKVSDIQLFAEQAQARGADFEHLPTLAAKMPDHDLWMGFIRDPDQNLIGIMSEVVIEQ